MTESEKSEKQEYKKIVLGDFTDKSEYYCSRVKALNKTEKFKTSFSIEISARENPSRITSFRLNDTPTVENFIGSQIEALAYFMADNNSFSEMTGEDITGENFTVVVENLFTQLIKKWRMSFYDGIRKFRESR